MKSDVQRYHHTSKKPAAKSSLCLLENALLISQKKLDFDSNVEDSSSSFFIMQKRSGGATCCRASANLDCTLPLSVKRLLLILVVLGTGPVASHILFADLDKNLLNPLKHSVTLFTKLI